MVLALLAACWDPLPTGEETAFTATTQRLTTSDGATIALHHHPGKGPPVLLVHGISSNHRYFDLDEGHNLADWLTARGHDVWMLDLRGHGDALYGDQRRQFNGWTVDDYGEFDVHLAISHIRQVTGAEKVDYIGHSMGGMVLAVYAAHHGDDALGAVVVLGSPAAFSKKDPLVGLAAAAMAAGGVSLLWFETPAFGAMAADLKGAVPFRLQEKLYNPANYTRETIDAMLRQIVSPIGRTEMQHFGRMLRDERFQSWDRKIDYFGELKHMKAPLLAIGSDHDEVVPAARVQAFSSAVGGESKYFLASPPNVKHSYGHLDYTLAEGAVTEIFPMVEAWLGRR